MQTNAQRVLAENLLLRSLLQDCGVPNAEVAAFLHTTHGGSENTSSAFVCPPMNMHLPRLPPPLHIITPPENLGKPSLPGAPPEARQDIHACRTVPSASPGCPADVRRRDDGEAAPLEPGRTQP